MFDSFFGRSVMNFGTTNIFLVICAFSYLTYRGYYKKEIPLALVFAYLISGVGTNLLLFCNRLTNIGIKIAIRIVKTKTKICLNTSLKGIIPLE